MLGKGQASQTQPSQSEGQANPTPGVTSDFWESYKNPCWATLPFQRPPAIHAQAKGTPAHQNVEHVQTSLLQEHNPQCLPAHKQHWLQANLDTLWGSHQSSTHQWKAGIICPLESH